MESKQKENELNTPHRHATIIKAWADGEKIEWRLDEGYQWQDLPSATPPVDVIRQYRIKPKRIYPKSTLEDAQIESLMGNGFTKVVFERARQVADAAVKQYIKEKEE